MPSFFEAAKEKIGQAYCGVSDFSVWYATQAAELLDTSPVGGLAEAQKQIFTYWNQLACGVDPNTPLPAAFEPPFNGGQCEGNLYRVYLNVNLIQQGGGIVPSNREFDVYGKIESINFRFFDFYGRPTPPATDIYVDIVHAGGTLSASLAQSFSPLFTGWEVVNIFPFNLTTQGADNCGDPDSANTPSNQPFSDTQDIDYTDENGNPQTAQNVTFTYGLPFVEPDGTISVPYEVCYDGFCFKGKTNFGDSLKVVPEPPLKAPIEESPACPTIEDIEALLNSTDRTDEILEKIQEVMDKIEDLPEPYLFVPQSWNYRIEGDRPQLIAGMYEVTTEKESPSKWDICIPHVRADIETFTIEDLQQYFPAYERGAYYARAVLNDNSAFMIHAKSTAAAREYITRLMDLVDPQKIPVGDYISTGQNPRISRSVSVEVRAFGFYKTGRKQGSKPTKKWYFPVQ